MTDTLTRIRAKCVEQFGDDRFWCTDPSCEDLDCREDGDGHNASPIRLADVLLAMHRSLYGGSPEYRESTMRLIDGCWDYSWNLREDDLEKQTPETVEFIGKLLDV